MNRVRDWFARIPTDDPFERRAAVTMQVFCMGLCVLIVVNETVRVFKGPWIGAPGVAYSTFANWTTIVTSLGAVALMRRGQVRRGFWLVCGSYVAILAGSLAIRGLEWHQQFLVRVYWVLLVLPALLLGRPALWSMLATLLAAMLVGYLRDEGILGAAPGLAAPEPQLGAWGQAIAVMLLLCIILDRFGTALRDAYAEAVSRREEAERASVALSVANRAIAQEAEQRAGAEALLYQSQKLEAVGRLSAGVAHDFNNVLTAIVGFAELGKNSLQPGHALRDDLDQIVSAAQRAAELTRQMLVFAKRQIVAPRTLLVEQRVRLVAPMLGRVLGEGVTFVERFAEDPWTVRIDPVQLDQILLNLAVNSRDAMPEGGTFTIETSHAVVEKSDRVVALGLEPGEHTRIRIVDTGVGMDEATLANVFEPFFTTKRGKGTGLGLATVYGIVRQAGGAVTVKSRPGQGTTFELLFPRGGPLDSDAPAAGSVPAKSASGEDTVLVVDDEPRILEISARTLRARGYTVLAANGPEEAREIAAAHPGEIALLVTDVVMPGGDGRTLATALRRQRPRLAVLYVSGHSDEVIARHGVLDPGIVLLAKPFTPEVLAAKVAALLEARRRAAVASA
jgi:signal transduction histidine kinase/ActR/RegA family two-component response regulator